MPFWSRRPKDPDAWLREGAAYYRRLGWFAEWIDLSEEQLLRKVIELLEEEGNTRPDPTDQSADVSLMALDDERVWWNDLEADVCRENQVYVELVEALGRISRGAIIVADVTERWDGEEGPITVEFTANGARQTVHPRYQDDWITEEAFLAFERLLRPTPYGLYTWDTQGQDYFCVVLREDEARLIRKQRGVALSLDLNGAQAKLAREIGCAFEERVLHRQFLGP